jgi:hypothetical protein
MDRGFDIICGDRARVAATPPAPLGGQYTTTALIPFVWWSAASLASVGVRVSGWRAEHHAQEGFDWKRLRQVR